MLFLDDLRVLLSGLAQSFGQFSPTSLLGVSDFGWQVRFRRRNGGMGGLESSKTLSCVVGLRVLAPFDVAIEKRGARRRAG